MASECFKDVERLIKGIKVRMRRSQRIGPQQVHLYSKNHYAASHGHDVLHQKAWEEFLILVAKYVSFTCMFSKL